MYHYCCHYRLKEAQCLRSNMNQVVVQLHQVLQQDDCVYNVVVNDLTNSSCATRQPVVLV